MALPTGAKIFYAKDKHIIGFGNGSTQPDVQLQWDGTNFIIEALTDDALIEFGDSGTTQKSFDLKWYGDDASGASYLYFDASLNLVYTTGVDHKLIDNDHLLIGTGTAAAAANGDVDIYWDATNLIIGAAADDSLIEVGDSAVTQKSFDVKWYANEASGASYVYFDASANLVYSTGVDVKLIDNDHLLIGTASAAATADGDVDVYLDATNQIVSANADDTLIEIADSAATQKSFDLKWYANEANGASYVYFDASANMVYSTGVDVKLIDNDHLLIGTATGAANAVGDVDVYWDATNLIIGAAADDTLIEVGDSAATQLSFDVKWYANENDGASYVYFDASANLVYSTGVDVKLVDNDHLLIGTASGAATADGDVDIYWDATNLIVAANADDTLIEIGDSNATQKSFDVKVYGDAASGVDYLNWDASKSELSFAGIAHLNPAGCVQVFDDFLGDVIADQYAVNADGGGTGAIVAAVGGTVALTTAAGDNNKVELATALNFSTSTLRVFEARVNIDTVTTVTANVGLSDAANEGATTIAAVIGAGDAITANADDGVMFIFDTDADTDGWFGALIGTTDELEGAGATAPVGGTFQTLRIEIDSTRKASFFIDGAAYGSQTAAALDATTALTPYFAVQNQAGGISRILTVDYFYIAATR